MGQRSQRKRQRKGNRQEESIQKIRSEKKMLVVDINELPLTCNGRPAGAESPHLTGCIHLDAFVNFVRCLCGTI